MFNLNELLKVTVEEKSIRLTFNSWCATSNKNKWYITQIR